MQLTHFYHIYADGNWYKPFIGHIEALDQSGLLDELGGSFNVGIVGSEQSYRGALHWIKNHEAPVKVVAHENEGWEQVTLDPLHDFAFSVDEAYILYAHTKGAANNGPHQDVWRKTMTQCNIGWWKLCVDALDSGCHAAGCHWMKNDGNRWFFGGNFFWVKASAVRTLPKCLRDHRWNAESWIGDITFTIPDFTVMNFFTGGVATAIGSFTPIPDQQKLWVASVDYTVQ